MIAGERRGRGPAAEVKRTHASAIHAWSATLQGVGYEHGDKVALRNFDGVLSLACDGVEVDVVESAAGSWPYGTGDGLQLDPGQEDALANDVPESWCRAVEEYAEGMNTGSPGAPDPPCRWRARAWRSTARRCGPRARRGRPSPTRR